MAAAASSSPSMTAARSCAAGCWISPPPPLGRSALKDSAKSPPKSFRNAHLKRTFHQITWQVPRPGRAPETAACPKTPAVANDGGLFRLSRPLQKALRIDVDFELQIALRLWACGQPLPQIVREIEAAGGFEQQAEAVAALDHGERRLRRTQQLHMLVPRCRGGKAARKAFGGRAIPGGDNQARKPAERRITGALACSDFTGIKCLAVAGDQRLHHGMVGLVRLQEADAAALVAPRTADHLVEQLPGALGGARIAVAKPEIGVDHADQIEPWKMMTLRHQLGADDDVDTAFGDLVELDAHGFDRGDQIAGQHHGARAGKQRGCLFLQALDTGTDGDQ